MNPKVSIIVPVYNVEKYLAQCLDSLINQTFQDIEIICFNDASTDNSLEILKNYASKDNRIQIIDSQINIRQGGGRNACIRASKAPYVMFVDPDDWVETNFIERYYQTITETNSDIVTGNYYIVNDDKISPQISLKNNLNNDTDLIKRLHTLRIAPIWINIYKKELFFDFNLFFPENVPLREDYVIAPALFIAAKTIIKIDDHLYYYRIHSESACHDKDETKFKYFFSTTLMLKENIEKIDKEKKFKEETEDLFITLYFFKPIMSALAGHNHILHDEIRYAINTIHNYVNPNQIKKYISKQNMGSRLIIITATYSSSLAFVCYNLVKVFSSLKLIVKKLNKTRS